MLLTQKFKIGCAKVYEDISRNISCEVVKYIQVCLSVWIWGAVSFVEQGPGS